MCELIVQTERDSKAHVTWNIFKYRVEKEVKKSERSHYIAEWKIIDVLDVGEHPETLKAHLDKARIGREIVDIAERAIDTLEVGDIDRAEIELKQSVLSMGLSHEDVPMVEVADYAERLELLRDKQVYPEKYLGIQTGFKTFDFNTGGLFPQELTLVAGITGVGKSTFTKQLETGIAVNNQGRNVLHIANEESRDQVLMKFDAQLTGTPYLDFKLARIENSDILEWQRVMDEDMKEPGVGRIFVKELPAFVDVTHIEAAFAELENRGIPIHVIVVDLLPHLKPVQQAWGENDEAKKSASDCKELSRHLKLSVVGLTQAATIVEEKQSRGKRAGKLDVYGSKAVVHVTNTFLMITEKGTDDSQTHWDSGNIREEWQRDVFWLIDIKKNRDGAPFYYAAKHSVVDGRVRELTRKEANDNDFDLMVDEEIDEPDTDTAGAEETIGTPDGLDEPDVDVEEEEATGLTGGHEKKLSLMDRLRKVKKD